MKLNPENHIQYDGETVQKIFGDKKRFHRARAMLPIEEKMKILIELQKIALAIRPKKDENDKRFVWRLY